MERHYAQTSKRPNTIRGTLSDFPEATTDYYTDGALVARYHHRHKFGVIF
jgi:hypothetical protein